MEFCPRPATDIKTSPFYSSNYALKLSSLECSSTSSEPGFFLVFFSEALGLGVLRPPKRKTHLFHYFLFLVNMTPQRCSNSKRCNRLPPRMSSSQVFERTFQRFQFWPERMRIPVGRCVISFVKVAPSRRAVFALRFLAQKV